VHQNELASASENGRIYLWDLDKRTLARVLDDPEDRNEPVRSLAFTLKGEHRLAAGYADGFIRVWDSHEPNLKPDKVRDQKGAVQSLAYAPSGNWLASAGQDGVVRVRKPVDLARAIKISVEDSTTDQPTRLAAPPNVANVWSLAFAPGRDVLAAGGEDRFVHLWHVDSVGPSPRVLTSNQPSPDQPGNDPAVVFVRHKDREFLASDSGEGIVQLLDLNQPATEIVVPVPKLEDIRELAFEPKRQWLAVAAGSGPPVLLDLAAPRPELLPPLKVPGQPQLPPIIDVAFSDDGSWLAAGSEDGLAWVWDMNHPAELPRPLLGHRGRVFVAFGPDNLLVSAGQDDGHILLRDADDPQLDKEIQTLADSHNQIQALAFSPADNLVASAAFDGTLELWDLNDPDRQPKILADRIDRVMVLEFGPDGWLAAGSQDGSVRLWNVRDSQDQPTILRSQGDGVVSLSFDKDGRLATGGQDYIARVWTVETTQLADLVCRRVWRNLSKAEWDQHVGDLVTSYRPACPALTLASPAGTLIPPAVPD
jgi:WD40 repeat protein